MLGGIELLDRRPRDTTYLLQKVLSLSCIGRWTDIFATLASFFAVCEGLCSEVFWRWSVGAGDLNGLLCRTCRISSNVTYLRCSMRTFTGWSIVSQMTHSPPSVSVMSLIRKCFERWRDCNRTALLDRITYQLSLSNWWPSIWPLLLRISSIHALTETNISCYGKLRALVRFLRWVNHGQMTIIDPFPFYLYYLRFMRNWLSTKLLIFWPRMPSYNLTSLHIGRITPRQPQCWR